MPDRSADWLEQGQRDLEQAEQSMQAGRKALKALNLSQGQQAWGHTLTRLWAALHSRTFQVAPPVDLEDRLRLLGTGGSDRPLT